MASRPMDDGSGFNRSYTPDFYVYRLPGLERVAKLTSRGQIGRLEFSPRGDEVAVSSRAGVEFWEHDEPGSGRAT